MRHLEFGGFFLPDGQDNFDFSAIPSISKQKVLELARCDWIRQSANCCMVGQPGIGRCHREAFRVHRTESAAAEDFGSVIAALEPRTSIL
jgi:hypothetical protein